MSHLKSVTKLFKIFQFKVKNKKAILNYKSYHRHIIVIYFKFWAYPNPFIGCQRPQDNLLLWHRKESFLNWRKSQQNNTRLFSVLPNPDPLISAQFSHLIFFCWKTKNRNLSSSTVCSFNLPCNWFYTFKLVVTFDI